MSRDLFLVAVSLALWGAGEGMFLIFQPIYLEQLGATPVKIGAILGALGMAMAAAHIPAGLLSDRIGRRPLIWAAWLIGTAAAGLMALATSLPGFVAGLLAYGVTAFVIPPLSSYITAARGSWSVARALTLGPVAMSIGAVISPWVGGRIAEAYTLRSVYYAAVGLFAASSVLILLIRPQEIETTESAGERRGAFINARFITYLGLVFLAVLATYLPQPLAPIYLQNVRHLDLSQIGQLASAGSIGIIVINLIFGQFSARRGFLAAQAVTGLFALLLWLGSGMPAFVAAYFLLGGYRATRSMAAALGRELVPQKNMGLAFGLIETTSASALMAASALAGVLYEARPTYMFPAGLGLVSLSVLVGAWILGQQRNEQNRFRSEFYGRNP